MTPQLHQLPHVRATFAVNCLVQIKANDPCEGQPALVEIISLNDMIDNYLANLKNIAVQNFESSANNEQDGNIFRNCSISEEIRNETLQNHKLIQEFPGPLTKERTSKAQVIQFCQKNIKDCLANANLIDPQSHSLLWDYLSLLVRQNGTIDLKTDLSPILLNGISTDSGDIQNNWKQNEKNASNSDQSNQDFVFINKNNENEKNIQLNEQEIHLNRLRQLLGAGLKGDAIEYAIKQNMWPHALFLASTNVCNTIYITNSNSQTSSQAESKLLFKVKLRFLNSLPQNDPINTCYQILIGRVPTVVSVTKILF